MTDTSAHFELIDAGVQFDTLAALESVSLDIQGSAPVALVGPSGAGKTTLLRLLNGTIRPTIGSVRINDRKLSDYVGDELRALRSSVAFIHQHHGLVPNLRVSQNVVAGRLGRMSLFESFLAMLRTPRPELERVHAILERVGIGDKLFERTDRLSGGQQQRVAVARALYQDPVAILADEPVSSVDPARARDLVELLTRIAREEGVTLVMSIHNLELAREFFPRVIGLRSGRGSSRRCHAARRTTSSGARRNGDRCPG